MQKSQPVLHVIVGAGNVRYFLNAINSVVSCDAGPVFAVYNYVSTADLAEINTHMHTVSDAVQSLIISENRAGKRTGSLYWANNKGLQFANDRFRYVSFMQADMQMMWWNKRIIERADEIVARLATRTSNIAFYTQLPVAGKRRTPYRGWDWSDDTESYLTTGHVDVSLLPIHGAFNNDFCFDGNEIELAESRRAKGSSVVLHPFPYLAPIPFPDTVRSPHRPRSSGSLSQESPLLRVAPNFSADFALASFHPVLMEQAVLPNGWRSLTPYWPSDTNSTKWLKTRGNNVGAILESLWQVAGHDGKRPRFKIRSFSPGYRVVVISLLRLLVEGLRRRLLGDRGPKS